MVAQTLSADDLALGRAVLLATDSLGMSAEGAFWLYDDQDRAWNYFLVTSLNDKIGPHGLYVRLNDTLGKKLSEHEMSNFMIYLASPRAGVARAVRSRIETSAYASEPVERSIRLGGRVLSAWVYRMAAALGERETNLARHRFSRISKGFAAA